MINEDAHDLLDWFSELIALLERVVINQAEPLPWYFTQKDIDRFKRLYTLGAKGLK